VKRGHVEWFKVEFETALKLIETVAVFAGEMPYTEDGYSVKPWWSEVDLRLANESVERRRRGRKKGKAKAPTCGGDISATGWLEKDVLRIIGLKDKLPIRRSETMPGIRHSKDAFLDKLEITVCAGARGGPLYGNLSEEQELLATGSEELEKRRRSLESGALTSKMSRHL